MPRWIPLAPLAIVAIIGGLTSTGSAQTVSFAGTWTLNRTLSQIPKEIGFAVIQIPPDPAGGQRAPASGGRGGRGGSAPQSGRAPGAFGAPRESYEDSQRRQLLTDEARNPSPQLTITERPGQLTIVDDQGRTRALSTTAIRQSLELLNIPVAVSTTNIQNRYIVVYDVSQDRKVRYIYSRLDGPSMLIVDIELIEQGKAGDTAHLVYEPGTASPAAAGATTSSATSGTPTATGRSAEAFDQRPGAELRGLRSLGVVVEALSPQAKACGLGEGPIEAALSKRLTDGGFTVRRNADNDTYLYVNIKTDRLPDGTCLSRYDTTIYSYTTAKMSYGTSAALVQVELMHRGGINASSAPHAPAIIRQLESDVDLFVAQIRTANR